jgi:hypothetical protein
MVQLNARSWNCQASMVSLQSALLSRCKYAFCFSASVFYLNSFSTQSGFSWRRYELSREHLVTTPLVRRANYSWNKQCLSQIVNKWISPSYIIKNFVFSCLRCFSLSLIFLSWIKYVFRSMSSKCSSLDNYIDAKFSPRGTYFFIYFFFASRNLKIYKASLPSLFNYNFHPLGSTSWVISLVPDLMKISRTHFLVPKIFGI